MLERHDAETLVDACTIEVGGQNVYEAQGDVPPGVATSWMDLLDADDHEALFEGIMWFSRVKPSLKKA